MSLASLAKPTAPKSQPGRQPAVHRFKSYAGDFLQGVSEDLQPILLAQWVLLGADHVDVVGDVIGRVIPRLSLPLGEKPGRDLLGRGGVTFNSKTQHRVSHRYISRIQTELGEALGGGALHRHENLSGRPTQYQLLLFPAVRSAKGLCKDRWKCQRLVTLEEPAWCLALVVREGKHHLVSEAALVTETQSSRNIQSVVKAVG